jgi:Flp pilus assembly protein TadG
LIGQSLVEFAPAIPGVQHHPGRSGVAAGPRPSQGPGRGQALVEFALVFTIFVTMLMGFLEFAFVFNALLSIGHATRDAALIAAEAGNNPGADCAILAQVEKDVSAPANPAQITQVVIYRSDQNGTVLGGQQNAYTRTGSTTCPMADGSSLTVPYTISGTAAYPASGRCNVQLGCPTATDPNHPLETIGVKVVYQHLWVTPLANLVALGGTGTTLTQSNAMRMEPVL